LKYLVKARIEVEGLVDKHDIIGAIFGQTENLFGEDFDLRELQERGRLGRVLVDVKHQGTKTVGEIQIPSNLDRVETALLAAMVESVDKVGPYRARIQVVDIIDMRSEKLKKIIARAKDLLRSWSLHKTPDLKEVLREIGEVVKKVDVIEYGPEKLPAGPDVDKSNEIIIVEGRADVINLLRYGYRNVIAIGGARDKIPATIAKLARSKKTIAFVDGDHAGDLILWELLKVVDIDYVARAPPGREVEELSGKEIANALSNLVPAKEYLQLLEKRLKVPPKKKPSEKPAEIKIPRPVEVVEEKPAEPIIQVEATEGIEIPPHILSEAKNLQATLEALIFDEKWNLIEKLPVREVYDRLEKIEPGKVWAVIFDGIVTQRMLDIASEKGIKLLVASRIGSIEKRPKGIIMLTFNDLF